MITALVPPLGTASPPLLGALTRGYPARPGWILRIAQNAWPNELAIPVFEKT